VSQEAPDQWREVLRSAIQASSSESVLGTHFRVALNAAAKERGLQFPPKNEPELRLIQLLQRYPDVVSVMRRPGQDFLVAPTGKSDLLAQRIQDRLYGIRHDLFEAFTTIGGAQPYYDKSQDQIVWHGHDENSMPVDYVPIEQTIEATEIEMRRDFIATISGRPTTAEALESALASPRPLQAFGRAVKEAALQREWHSFRTKRVVDKIQRWASDHQIAWKDAWLTEALNGYSWKSPGAPSPSEESIAAEGDPLQSLFSGLDAADLQRISIPLDLVLKAIAKSRKH